MSSDCLIEGRDRRSGDGHAEQDAGQGEAAGRRVRSGAGGAGRRAAGAGAASLADRAAARPARRPRTGRRLCARDRGPSLFPGRDGRRRRAPQARLDPRLPGRLLAPLARRDPDRAARSLDPETFLRDHYAGQRPVVIGGLVDHWPALSLWTADYLEQRIGRETPVEAQKGRESRKDFELRKLELRRTVPFGEIADALRSAEPSNDLYVTANNGAGNRAAFEPVWGDFGPIEGYTVPRDGQDGYLWIGPAGTITPFHHDLTNNLLVQVRGRKRVHMVPNWEEARMKTARRIFSDWTLEALQEAGDKGPVLLETEIGPGDALFIPVGWWHHVVSLDASCSVLFTNFAWPNDFATPFMEGR
ncbi:hypothetical protein HY78_11090 [Rhizorhabdus wittichii DC-6]|nr:hypothetical protein HY78_11090 [Rhizorhabdus wittichii DC-6]